MSLMHTPTLKDSILRELDHTIAISTLTPAGLDIWSELLVRPVGVCIRVKCYIELPSDQN